MAGQSIGEQFVGILVRAGVERVYGIVGDCLNPITDAVRRTPGIDRVQVRHEESAAFAAGTKSPAAWRP